MTRQPGLLPIGGALPSARADVRVGELVDKPQTPATHYISRRSHALWKRLRNWYPNKLPEEAPRDYCTIIDAATREELSRLLVSMRAKHVSWPPTFPEFSQLYEQAKAPPVPNIDWGERVDAVRQYALRKHWAQLTDYQRFMPWTSVFTGRMGTPEYALLGIRIPDDPVSRAAGLFVRVSEMTP